MEQQVSIRVRTDLANPVLHLWMSHTCTVDGCDITIPQDTLRPIGEPENGWYLYQTTLDNLEHVRFKVCNMVKRNGEDVKEQWDPFIRSFMVQDKLCSDVWLSTDSETMHDNKILSAMPNEMTLHVITANRYKDSILHMWDTSTLESQDMPLSEVTEYGVKFTVTESYWLQKGMFNFILMRKEGDRYVGEPKESNRSWSMSYGTDCWIHSEGSDICTTMPTMVELKVNYKCFSQNCMPMMNIWQNGHGFQAMEESQSPDAEWHSYSRLVFTGLHYGINFRLDSDSGDMWEMTGMERYLSIDSDSEIWILEGSPTIFTKEPKQNQTLEISLLDFENDMDYYNQPDNMHVWIHNSFGNMMDCVEQSGSKWKIKTYPNVRTNFKLMRDGNYCDAVHSIFIDNRSMRSKTTKRCLIPSIPQMITEKVDNPFMNPPFTIRRPGAYREGDMMNFVIHAPSSAKVELMGEWMDAPKKLMRTMDGTYWWTQEKISDIRKDGMFHGMKYHYILNENHRIQDPAASWIENTNIAKGSSLLLDSDSYSWLCTDWQRPGWEYYSIYQLHASRFTKRHIDPETQQPLVPFRQIEEEIKTGYLSDMGATAIQLLPINAFPGKNSWGYNPSFFFAVEESYGSPNDLKSLVDTCHQRGIAVIVDLVFNHAGPGDNILFVTERKSYFKGDTAWGSMINFGHPQCQHYFMENVKFLLEEFKIDGFRFDHTKTIREGGNLQYGYVREAGSNQGWMFMHKIREAIKSVDNRAIMMAEHLPNEWDMTNYGGPMDSQWCDDFHDRLVYACKSPEGNNLVRLAQSMETSRVCQQWYNATMYPESHDEVGNVNERIAHVGSYGEGYRKNKIAAAVTMMSKGIPMWFMGAESGETSQFYFDRDNTMDLDAYESDTSKTHVRNWWKSMIHLRKGNPVLQGPSDLHVQYANKGILAFSRGKNDDIVVISNFGDHAEHMKLGDMNINHGSYKELFNSTWPEFQVEQEQEMSNGGHSANLESWCTLNIPQNGSIVLQKK